MRYVFIAMLLLISSAAAENPDARMSVTFQYESCVSAVDAPLHMPDGVSQEGTVLLKAPIGDNVTALMKLGAGSQNYDGWLHDKWEVTTTRFSFGLTLYL